VLVSCHRIGLVVHEGRAAAVEAAGRVREWAAARDIPVAQLDVWSPDAQRRSAADEAAAGGHPDLVVTIGGDGTLLRGVRIAVRDDAPVLGVGVGRVGFLTEIPPAEVETALDAYASGHATVEMRIMLGMRASRPLTIPAGIEGLLKYGRGPLLPPPGCRPDPIRLDGYALDVTAMNDVVLEKLARDRQADLGVYLDGRLFESYSADAVIVGSPTGSTAYSFAAGGPVLSPRLRALILTPVAPHMVFNRSLVVAGDEGVGVRVLDSSGPVAVSVDGQLRGVVDPGDWIDVRVSPRSARLVRLRPPRFYDRLRHRFALAAAPAIGPDGAPQNLAGPLHEL
jgi:NAD+ kinase